MPSTRSLPTMLWLVLAASSAAAAAGAELPAAPISHVVADARANGECGTRMEEARRAERPSRVLLATLPDPVETVYAREFDSIFESMIRAAGQAGYEIAQVCLPWSAEDDARREHESEPGVVVLRSEATVSCEEGDCLLVLLLVGERPQEGVRPAVVHRALDVAAAQVPGADFEIVGPTFSASAESLARALASWRPDDRAVPRSFRIRSGSTTDPRVATLLAREIGESGGSVDFRSLAVSHADLQSCVWNRLVRGRLGLDVRWPIEGGAGELRDHPCAPSGTGSDNSRIALLVERSDYGRQFEPDGFRVVHFTPHLPYLRAAYGSQAPAGDADSAANGEAADRGTNLPLRLGRSVAQRFPFFDREGTVVSQDLVLRSTLRRLARLKVQVVGIVATNVMDKLFLADMVRDLVPNARLVTFEGDILLSHPAFLRSTVGTLVASSHPLLSPVGGGGSGQDLQFDFDAAQGAYRAADELLSGRPAGGPTLWMTVVGRGGLYPLARIPLDAPASGPAGREEGVEPSPAPGTQQEGRLPNAWLLLVLLATVGVAAIFTSAAGQLRLRHDRLLGVIPSALVRSPSLTGGGNALQALLALVPLVLGLPYLILLVPLDTYRRADTGTGGPAWTEIAIELTLAAGACLLVLLLLTFLYLVGLLVLRTGFHLAALRREPGRPPRGAFVRALLPLAAVFAAAAVAGKAVERWGASMAIGDENPLLTIERLLSLSNGVSPVLPSLIIGLVVTGWIVLALYRQRCVEWLPEPAAIASLGRETREPIDGLRASIEPVSLQLRASWGWWLVLCLIPFLYIGLFFLDLRSWPVRGIEGRSFDEATSLLLLVTFVLAIASGLSLHNGWRALRALLLRIDRLKARWPELGSELQEGYSAAVEALGEARAEGESRLAALRAEVDPVSAPKLVGRLDDGLGVSWARVLAWMAESAPNPAGRVDGAARAFFASATAVLVRRTYLQLIHLRTFMTCALLGLLLALLSYPFEPERLLRLYASILVAAGALLSATVLVQARKAAKWNFLVKEETRTEGLGDLTVRLAFHAGLPALGLVAGRFPHIGGPLLQWIEQLARPFG